MRPRGGGTSHQAQADRRTTRTHSQNRRKPKPGQGKGERDEGQGGGEGGEGGPEDTNAGSSLLLLGEFQSVAEDLDSLLLMTGSTCLGKLTVEAEHLPTGENATDNNCSRLRTETTPVWARRTARRSTTWSNWPFPPPEFTLEGGGGDI